MLFGRVFAFLLVACNIGSIRAQEISMVEVAGRRAALMERLDDGLVLLHAKSGPKEMDQPGWIQDATFLYFTGVRNQPGAVLVVDGPAAETHLFLPPPPLSFGRRVSGLLTPGPNTAEQLGLHTVQSWDNLTDYLRRRVGQGIRKFYVDQARRRELLGTPDDLWPIAGKKRTVASKFGTCVS